MADSVFLGAGGDATELQGTPIASTAPGDGEVLTYDSGTGEWGPAAGGGGGDVTASGTLTANALIIGGGTTVVAATTTGAGILTFLGTPSSANLAAAVTDETGSGALVFATSPTFVTPVLGAATFTTLSGTTNSAGAVNFITVANNVDNGRSWVNYSIHTDATGGLRFVDASANEAFAQYRGDVDTFQFLTVGGGTYSFGTSTSTVPGSLNIVSTGVNLAAANGILTILGTGTGADESLTIDLNTATNTVIFGSGSGATLARFNALIIETVQSGVTTQIVNATNFMGTAGGAMGTLGAQPLSFFTNSSGTETLTIDNNGFVAIGRSSAPASITRNLSHLLIGQTEFGANSYRMIGFGYAGVNNLPAYMGFQEISATGNTFGDLIFLTRSVTTDTAPTERLRILNDGTVNFGVDGVKVTAADGVWTMLGLGNGADESLTIDLDNAGANTIGFGSGTGAALFTFTGISLRPGGYESSDGTAGVTAGPFTAVTGITVKNGLVTALTGT